MGRTVGGEADDCLSIVLPYVWTSGGEVMIMAIIAETMIFTCHCYVIDLIFAGQGPFILASLCTGRRRRAKVDIVSTRAMMSPDGGRCPTTPV